MLTLKNALYYAPEGRFVRGSLSVNGGKILPPETEPAGEIWDLGGRRVLPGLIDIHTHGAVGIDAMDASPEELVRLAQFYASRGVTSFLPTTMTEEPDVICGALSRIRRASQSGAAVAAIVGAHIEGPYLNPEYRGAHDQTKIRLPQTEECRRFFEALGGLRLRITLAPERAGAEELIRFVRQNGGEVALGHCGADYETCCKALKLGANSFTHLFNAMRGLHHREPGPVGAAFLSDAYAELICDGVHLHPEIVRLICRVKGSERMVLITDSMRAAGMPDGVYELGGQKVNVREGVARTEDGTLAGSTLTLLGALKNLMRFTGWPLEKALPAATVNPAEAVGMNGAAGTIEAGKRADLLIVDENLDLLATLCAGRLAYAKEPMRFPGA